MSAKNSNSHFARPNWAGNMFKPLSRVLWCAGLVLGLTATPAIAAEPPTTAAIRHRELLSGRSDGILTDQSGE